MITKGMSKMLYILPLALTLQLSAFSISSASGITRADLNSAHKIVNGSASTGHPHPQFFYPQNHPLHTTVETDDRNPRQWMSNYGYGYPFGGYGGLGMFGGAELLITCLLVILGIGVIGLPFLMLIFSAFSGGQGVNFIPPTTTTTVAGRKRREAIFPSTNPGIQGKLLDILSTFYKASDKMKMFKKLLDD